MKKLDRVAVVVKVLMGSCPIMMKIKRCIEDVIGKTEKPGVHRTIFDENVDNPLHCWMRRGIIKRTEETKTSAAF